MNAPTLKAHFNEWMDSVHGDGWRIKLPQIQQTELERAYISGFASFYFLTLEISTRPESETMALLGKVNAEIEAYFAEFKRMPVDLKGN